jgi:hypothetical protein
MELALKGPKFDGDAVACDLIPYPLLLKEKGDVAGASYIAGRQNRFRRALPLLQEGDRG